MKIPSKPVSDSVSVEQKLKDVGQLYEKHFLREMVKAMRSTVQESGFIPVSSGEKIFREQLDHEYVEKWGAQGGIGLADMIYQQMVEKYGAQLGLKSTQVVPKGPIDLKTQDQFTITKNKTATSSNDGIQWQLQKNPNWNSPVSLTNPWSGHLLKSWQHDEKSILDIQHDLGLQTRLMFSGTKNADLQDGQFLEPGQRLGLLSPDALSFYWTLQQKIK